MDLQSTPPLCVLQGNSEGVAALRDTHADVRREARQGPKSLGCRQLDEMDAGSPAESVLGSAMLGDQIRLDVA